MASTPVQVVDEFAYASAVTHPQHGEAHTFNFREASGGLAGRVVEVAAAAAAVVYITPAPASTNQLISWLCLPACQPAAGLPALGVRWRSRCPTPASAEPSCQTRTK